MGPSGRGQPGWVLVQPGGVVLVGVEPAWMGLAGAPRGLFLSTAREQRTFSLAVDSIFSMVTEPHPLTHTRTQSDGTQA